MTRYRRPAYPTGVVDIVGRREHYFEHLLPVWRALPDGVRGDVMVPPVRWRSRVLERIGAPLPKCRLDGRQVLTHTLAKHVLLASAEDYKREGLGRRLAYLNHGVGQAWRDKRGWVPRGAAMPKPGVSLFLVPGAFAERVTREVHPDARVVNVGVPKLDAFAGRAWESGDIIVFSTHWNMANPPEAMGVLGEFERGISALRGYRVMLHAHPKDDVPARAMAARLGVPFIESFAEVLERASVYATDSSSTLFEFAAVGKPVVVLNGRAYRRDHEHGLRFWEAASVGVNVDDERDLQSAVDVAFADSRRERFNRARAVALAYGPHGVDGGATARAVAALVEWCSCGS